MSRGKLTKLRLVKLPDFGFNQAEIKKIQIRAGRGASFLGLKQGITVRSKDLKTVDYFSKDSSSAIEFSRFLNLGSVGFKNTLPSDQHPISQVIKKSVSFVRNTVNKIGKTFRTVIDFLSQFERIPGVFMIVPTVRKKRTPNKPAKAANSPEINIPPSVFRTKGIEIQFDKSKNSATRYRYDVAAHSGNERSIAFDCVSKIITKIPVKIDGIEYFIWIGKSSSPDESHFRQIYLVPKYARINDLTVEYKLFKFTAVHSESKTLELQDTLSGPDKRLNVPELFMEQIAWATLSKHERDQITTIEIDSFRSRAPNLYELLETAEAKASDRYFPTPEIAEMWEKITGRRVVDMSFNTDPAGPKDRALYLKIKLDPDINARPSYKVRADYRLAIHTANLINESGPNSGWIYIDSVSPSISGDEFAHKFIDSGGVGYRKILSDLTRSPLPDNENFSKNILSSIIIILGFCLKKRIISSEFMMDRIVPFLQKNLTHQNEYIVGTIESEFAPKISNMLIESGEEVNIDIAREIILTLIDKMRNNEKIDNGSSPNTRLTMYVEKYLEARPKERPEVVSRYIEAALTWLDTDWIGTTQIVTNYMEYLDSQTVIRIANAIIDRTIDTIKSGETIHAFTAINYLLKLLKKIPLSSPTARKIRYFISLTGKAEYYPSYFAKSFPGNSPEQKFLNKIVPNQSAAFLKMEILRFWKSAQNLKPDQQIPLVINNLLSSLMMRGQSDSLFRQIRRYHLARAITLSIPQSLWHDEAMRLWRESKNDEDKRIFALMLSTTLRTPEVSETELLQLFQILTKHFDIPEFEKGNFNDAYKELSNWDVPVSTFFSVMKEAELKSKKQKIPFKTALISEKNRIESVRNKAVIDKDTNLIIIYDAEDEQKQTAIKDLASYAFMPEAWQELAQKTGLAGDRIHLIPITTEIDESRNRLFENLSKIEGKTTIVMLTHGNKDELVLNGKKAKDMSNSIISAGQLSAIIINRHKETRDKKPWDLKIISLACNSLSFIKNLYKCTEILRKKNNYSVPLPEAYASSYTEKYDEVPKWSADAWVKLALIHKEGQPITWNDVIDNIIPLNWPISMWHTKANTEIKNPFQPHPKRVPQILTPEPDN